jgi:hypothetical protein
VNGLDASYLVTVNTGNGTGEIRLDLKDDDSITDFSGNKLGGINTENGDFINGEIYSIQKSTPKVVSIVCVNPNPSNAGSADFIITFSESVTGVDISDFNLSTVGIDNASIGAVSGSANIYIISAQTGSGDGSIRLDLIDNDSIVNGIGYALGDAGLGNGNFTNGESYTVDKTAPVITSSIRSGANPSSASSVDFIVAFSESVVGVDRTDFSLHSSTISNMSINRVSGVDPFYIVNINPGNGSGTIRLDLLDDDSITDLAGNQLGGFGFGNGNFINGESYDIERSMPIVTSIISASPNPSNASSVDFIVTFSESVTGVDASDFSLNTTNILGTSVVNVNNVDPFYIVSINTGVGTGSIRLDLLDDDSIMDVSGNKPGGEGVRNGDFVNGETINIAKTPVNFPAPTLRDPRRNFLTNNSSPAFSWTKVRGATAYEITIAKDSSFTQVAATATVNGLSYTSNPALPDGIYYWHVRAYNSDFQPGKFSVSNTFTIDTTPPAAPGLVSPVNDATVSARLKFVWEKISEAIRYQVEIDNNADFSSPEWSALRPDANYQVFTIRSGFYFWRVRAKDMAGNWSSWSISRKIIIP